VAQAHPMRPSTWLHLLLLWLAGISLRLSILAVPPLLPAIHHTLRLDESAVGALTSLPILLLGAAAVPGSLLISGLGARRALAAGLALIAIAGALRGAGPSTAVLFLMTVLLGVGVAVSQPALPSLVRMWFPNRAALATAVYSNGFLVGEILAASLTGSAILPAVGSWEVALAVWSVPVVVTGAAMLLGTAHVPRPLDAERVPWWPNWRSSTTWRLGFIMGGASVAYFTANAFLPDYLRSTHHAGLITAALFSINTCQLPASFIVAAIPQYIVGRRWPIAAAAGLVLVAVAGFALGGFWVVVWAGLLGFATASVFVVALSLPPILAGPGDIHRLSAAMFTISYVCAFAGSFVGGAIWDSTGSALASFSPILVAGLAMAALVANLRVPPGLAMSTEAAVPEMW
jgi:CP family cyanate transporter-like MFS transporter